MKLYHAWLSSASRRVRFCLAEKGLPFDSVALDLRKMEQHEPAYLALNPNGVVPTLQLDDGRVIYESSTICEYLDDIVPEPPLRPTDPFQRAAMRNFVRYIDEKILLNLMVLNWSISLAPTASKWTDTELQEKVNRIPMAERREAWTRVARKNFSDEERATALRQLVSLVDTMEGMLAGGTWLIGGTYSIADIAAAPFIARISEVAPDAVAKSPRVAAWWQAIQQRPAYAKAGFESFAAAVAKRAAAEA